jgi:two-component system sensor histidine kinase CpxA
MKSLYARMLLWSLATLLITGVGLVAVSILTAPPAGTGLPNDVGGPGLGLGPGLGPWMGGRKGPGGFRRGGPGRPVGPGRLVEVTLRIWETGGADALREHLSRIYAIAGVEVVLARADGTDVLTGEDHSAAIRRLRWHHIVPALVPLEHGGQALNGMPSRDGQYWLVTYRPGVPRRFPLLPYQLWVFVSAAVISFFLARSLTAPVRKLRAAVERFGRGDLSARTNIKRGDEIGELGRAFDNMAGRIQTLVEAERRLLIDISHELRSPLTRLGLAVELARTGEDRQAALDRIQREADRLNSLVGGLLEVNRGEADPSSVHRIPLRLDELLQEVANDCRYDAESKGCRIQVQLSETRPTIDGDPELIRRAVENVLRNAVRFSPASGVIELSMHTSENHVTIRVRDFGPGVPEQALPHLFEAFYRVRDTAERHQDGFGLGLSIARRAVALHRGTIRAENAHPGLLVEITLPLQTATLASLPA